MNCNIYADLNNILFGVHILRPSMHVSKKHVKKRKIFIKITQFETKTIFCNTRKHLHV